MKKSDWILVLAIFLAVCLSAGFLYGSRDRGYCVSIQIDGAEYGRYDLSADRVIEIGETNRLEIRDGKASMVHADCPDQLCVHQKAISKDRETIVCLPNRVVVQITGGEEGVYDSIAK